MSLKLRELIRAVRACKTAAEERAVIAKECAMIRTSFKTRENPYRHRNVAKLLYMHMLGYPTHFGQMECVKLIAAPSFPEKRIGYLGLMTLLDEKQKVLMLVTNSMKNDFMHKNPYIVGLALAALGNICSADMARDLAPEIEKFFTSPNAYIRKKAALCAVRIVRKVPEIVEEFSTSVQSLLNDKNNAVLLTATTLIIEIIAADSKQVTSMRKLVPTIVRLLKNLVLAGYVSEYDVVGITDPFLQCRLIHLLRLLGTGDREASDFMNDILAQVAINTEPTKNPGNAILYETVQCIMSIEAEGGLRVLAINILGRFLSNSRDNNIRYVALQTLCKCVSRDTQAIQRHRNTIVDCLKDADISIRRRALDLIYALVTKSNVKALVKELLNYLALTSGDNDFKADLTEKICMVVEKFAPSKHWHIDTIISVLATAGNFTRENVSTDLITLIARSSPSLQAYSTYLLYQSTHKKTKHAQVPLLHVCMWCVGEFGESLVSTDGLSKASEVDSNVASNWQVLTQSKVLDVVSKVMNSPVATQITRQYVLNALVKLSNKYSQETERIREYISTYQSSMFVELQQRSVEYGVLSSNDLDKIRGSIVARMPVPTKVKKEKSDINDVKESIATPRSDEEEEREEPDEEEEAEEEIDEETEEEKKAAMAIPKANGVVKKQAPPPAAAGAGAGAGGVDLFDLGLFGNDSVAVTSPQPSGGGGSVDFLSELFGGAGPAAAPSQPTASSVSPTPANGGAASGILDLFGTPPPTNTTTVSANNNNAFFGGGANALFPSPGVTPEKVFESKGLSVHFVYERDPSTPEITKVKALFSNSTSADFTNFDFQIAVLKHVTLTMNPATSSTIPSGTHQSVSQSLILNNSQHGKKKLVIRVKIDYNTAGAHVTEQAQIDKFPA